MDPELDELFPLAPTHVEDDHYVHDILFLVGVVVVLAFVAFYNL